MTFGDLSHQNIIRLPPQGFQSLPIMYKLPILFLFITVCTITFAQDCDNIRKSSAYFSASSTGATENEARINALSLLAENISSVVSSRTDMLTKDNGTAVQTFYNSSKSTSVLHLKGVSYLMCEKSKKSGTTVVAFISKKDLSQSAEEVAARVRQYIELMESKEAKGMDFLPEAYIAYLHTFMSPYAIQYHSGTRDIGNVKSYLESFLRTYVSNVSVLCTGVSENTDYPDQQLTLSLALSGTNDTHMGFVIDIPEYSAMGNLDYASNTMDVIMAPDGKKTKFSGMLSLVPPPVEADLKDISERVRISREVSFDADMTDLVKLDFNSSEQGDRLVLTPAVRHLTIRQIEWMSEGRLLSTDQRATVPSAGLKEITLRINGSRELTVTKAFNPTAADSKGRSAFADGQSLIVELIQGRVSSIIDVPSDTRYPDDANVIVQTELPNLLFRSSMSAIDRQTYNSDAGRYEIFIKPVKQLLSVESGVMENEMGVINPQSKNVIRYRIKGSPAESTISKGLLSITSNPPNASIFINDVETIYKTPFTIMLADGFIKLSLRKKFYQSMDTIVHVDPSHPIDLKITLVRQTGYEQDVSALDALSYLKGRSERNYYSDNDPFKLSPQGQTINYQRQSLILKRKAVMAYSMGGLGLMMGVGYHWLNNMIYDNSISSSGHSSVLGTFSTVGYVMGGVGIITGIIYSTKLSHLKKNWSVAPAPNARMGVGIVYKF